MAGVARDLAQGLLQGAPDDVDAQVVQGAPGRAGLNEAALDSVKRRRYRPATKDGVPVKVWMSVRMKFELPK